MYRTWHCYILSCGREMRKISIEAPKKVTLTTEKILKPKKESVPLYSETKTTGWNDKIVALEKT